MVNILLEGYQIAEPWLYESLKRYIKAEHKVAVVAFSFHKRRVHTLAAWNNLYGRECGMYYRGIVDAFAAYGIREENITFLNYFADSKEQARQKVEQADILYFLGGSPGQMMKRIKAFELSEVMAKHEGIIMGYSAGAVIQLVQYHLSPGEFPYFAYYEGLPYLDGFYLEVHYDDSELKNDAIRRVLQEKHKPVYALRKMEGGLLIENGNITPLGKVDCFLPETE